MEKVTRTLEEMLASGRSLLAKRRRIEAEAAAAAEEWRQERWQDFLAAVEQEGGALVAELPAVAPADFNGYDQVEVHFRPFGAGWIRSRWRSSGSAWQRRGAYEVPGAYAADYSPAVDEPLPVEPLPVEISHTPSIDEAVALCAEASESYRAAAAQMAQAQAEQ